jgi:hydroxyethylthiazole kinase/thiamine-phosphate diphosphorylase
MKKSVLKLVLITQRGSCPLEEYLEFIRTCVKAGVTAVQLREKKLIGDQLLDYATALHACLKKLNIPLIINDSLELCLKLNAEGLHLGQSDGDIFEARKKLGPEKLIGLSTDTLAQAQRANYLPIDYIGVGAIFPSDSKLDIKQCGISGLQDMATITKHALVAVGGLNPDNITPVVHAGATGFAAIAIFHRANNPMKTTYNLRKKIALAEIKNKKPLILNLTNLVTMDLIANALLAIGAAPLMSNCEEELEELIALSSALTLNIGTLNQSFITRASLAIKIAHAKGKPIVFDPVGAGATTLRTLAAKQLLAGITVLKGNASEILALADQCHQTKGVESIHHTADAKEAAFELAQQYQCVVVVTGKIDFITNGDSRFDLCGGSDLMPLVTGMGCTLAAIIAAFTSVTNDPLIACLLAMTHYNHCGEQAALQASHPGGFRSEFIGALYDQ